jgi:hypothetical protein
MAAMAMYVANVTARIAMVTPARMTVSARTCAQAAAERRFDEEVAADADEERRVPGHDPRQSMKTSARRSTLMLTADQTSTSLP